MGLAALQLGTLDKSDVSYVGCLCGLTSWDCCIWKTVGGAAVDLPCIIETHRTRDHKQFYKSGNVSKVSRLYAVGCAEKFFVSKRSCVDGCTDARLPTGLSISLPAVRALACDSVWKLARSHVGIARDHTPAHCCYCVCRCFISYDLATRTFTRSSRLWMHRCEIAFLVVV